MKKSIISSMKHLVVFVLIELVFVFVLFHEFPSIDIFSAIGIGHLTYWIVTVIAGYLRGKFKLYWQKFLTTYVPVVYHLLIHVWIARETVEHVGEHGHDHEMAWMILGVLGLGVLIFLGEYWLHRGKHCLTHHKETHKCCHDEECVDEH